MKIIAVVGTRPEAIKMAPVIVALRSRGARVLVCSTGQHSQMVEAALRLFGIKPDIKFRVMRKGQAISDTACLIIRRLGHLLRQHPLSMVVAQGDTTTTLAAAVCSFYNRTPFAHVEAGLRSHDVKQPFPEEFNRRCADIAADLLFAPTDLNRRALLAEGIDDAKIHVTGNTIVDALLRISQLDYKFGNGPLAPLQNHEKIVIVTSHRRENIGEPLRNICKAVCCLAAEWSNENVAFVWPVHPNPMVKKTVVSHLSKCPNVYLLPPLDYLTFVHLLKRSRLVLTDSGGIQEEAPTFGVPVLILRSKTERIEGIKCGSARIIGTRQFDIVKEARKYLSARNSQQLSKTRPNPYGDGKAGIRIATIIKQTLERWDR